MPLDLQLVLNGIVLALVSASLIVWLWRRARARQSKTWSTAEAEITSGASELVAHTRYGQLELPVFAFSYQVGSHCYGGRFALRPYITDPGPSVIERMIGRKLQVRYDPRCPEAWFIPDEYIEGCTVEQTLSPHFFNFEPKN